MIKSVEELKRLKEEYSKALAREKMKILVCAGTGCVSGGSLKVYEAIKKLLEEKNIYVDIDLYTHGKEGVNVSPSGCHGFCEMGPIVRIEPQGYFYVRVKEEDAREIVEKTVERGEVVERLLYKSPETGEVFMTEESIPFYGKQSRIVLEHCGKINPENIKEYIAVGGYQALVRALQMTSEEICQVILKAKLRGRGGAGFPAGVKWDSVRKQKADVKYVICNGDEGDPGAFMDRSIMEGDPHRVIEGMIIAGYASGATEGYIYVRAEYPLAVRRLKIAIEQAREFGLLGRNILGSGFDFDIKINKGAGAFVCGEGSALIASIEGNRGMPRTRPPRTVEKGLFGKPTVLNNVETFANVPMIILKGADWYLSIGTENSPGTKAFALTGNIVNTGLIEVPMGTTLREIIYEIGGGIPNGKELKAVQIGGPSGGCLTKEHLDLPLDFDSLDSVGAMIGSGGMVVIDQDACMVEVARFFMDFTQRESCGKCVPCREGTRRMLELLEKITRGEGTEADIELLEELAITVKDGSLCGLGETAPNPVLTTLKYFRDEYLAHVRDKRCPAGVCQALKRYVIDPALCRGCSKCARVCPAGAISGEVKKPFIINADKCIKCGACVDACPFKAVKEGK
ncbi:NADH-quinone oxidoreductase subunit NuoF [Thermovorax subterraneus]|nr:NADH-quinone oxidoreductase subunit NuoF [Thermovorax subterraneus]